MKYQGVLNPKLMHSFAPINPRGKYLSDQQQQEPPPQQQLRQQLPQEYLQQQDDIQQHNLLCGQHQVVPA